MPRKSPLYKTLVLIAYILIFWLALPALLFLIGLGLEGLLPPGGALTRELAWPILLVGFVWTLYAGLELSLRGKGLPVSHLPPEKFVARGLYRYFRHPVYVGYNIAFIGLGVYAGSFWTAFGSGALLLFAWICYTRYFEEPVLLKRFGETYRRHQENTGLLMPRRNLDVNLELRVLYLGLITFIYTIWGVLYYFIADAIATSPHHTPALALDYSLPLIVEFEYIYLLCYPLPLVPLFLIQDSGRLNRLFIAFILINLVALPCFYLYPVEYPRPEIHVDSLAAWLLALEYRADPPLNNLPSLHAALAWLVFLGTFSAPGRFVRLRNLIILLTAIGISVSTLLVKQHFIVDIVAGTALAFLAYWLAGTSYFLNFSEKNGEKASG